MPRLLKVIEPLLQGLLDVEPPAKRVPYQSRVMWSLAAALVYISLGQVACLKEEGTYREGVLSTWPVHWPL